MSKSERLKGVNAERELVRYFKDERGWKAHRTANSGGQPGYCGDVECNLDECPCGCGRPFEWNPRRIEVKRRKAIPKWLRLQDGVDAVAIREDNGEWLVLQRMKDWEP